MRKVDFYDICGKLRLKVPRERLDCKMLPSLDQLACPPLGVIGFSLGAQ